MNARIRWIAVVAVAVTFSSAGTALALRGAWRSQEDDASKEHPLGVRIFDWSDPDVARGFDESGGIGAIVLTREARKQPPHAAPKGWMRCDGSLLKVVDHPKLAKHFRRDYCIASDPEGSFRLPSIKWLCVRDWSIPGRWQMISRLDCMTAYDDAVLEPDPDPKSQAAILDLCDNDPRDMVVVVWVRVREAE